MTVKSFAVSILRSLFQRSVKINLTWAKLAQPLAQHRVLTVILENNTKMRDIKGFSYVLAYAFVYKL